MKKMNKDLGAKSEAELAKEKLTLKTDIKKLMIERKIKVSKDTNVIAKKKNRLAVILTLMRQNRDKKTI